MSQDLARLPIADVVVITCNSSRYIEACLASIPLDLFRIIVVDNSSSDDTLAIVRRRFPRVEVVENGANLGYGKACNVGFSLTKAEYVILSNADVVYPPRSVETLVDFLRTYPRVGVTAPQFIYPDGSWQISYAETPSVWTGLRDAVGINSARRWLRRYFWPRRIDRRPKDVPYVAGAVLGFRRRAFQEVRGFDEDFYFYAEESDLCIRLRKNGWRVVFCPLTQVVHVGGGHSVLFDRSDRFLRQMVKSQSLLASKHLTPRKARIYSRLQIYNFIRLRLTYRLLDFFGTENFSTSYKMWTLETYINIWKEFLRSGELM